MKLGDAAQEVIIGIHVLRRLALGTIALGMLQLRRDGAHNARGHPILQLEDILNVAVKALCPKVRARRDVDELSRYAHSVCGLSHAAFEDVAYPQLATGLPHIHRPTLVGEAGVARDDKQRSKARQRRDDFFHHAVGEVFLFRVAAHVLKWQNGDGWLVRKRKARRTAADWSS